MKPNDAIVFTQFKKQQAQLFKITQYLDRSHWILLDIGTDKGLYRARREVRVGQVVLLYEYRPKTVLYYS